MKVIQASVDLATWSREVTCTSCESVLEVESSDISYQWANDSNCYHASCSLCDYKMYFKASDLPKIVIRDAEKNRHINNTCSSDW